MKQASFFLSLILTGLFFLTGCNDQRSLTGIDKIPPAVPRGVQAENSDGFVYLSWISVRDNDLSGYNVYYSDRYDGKYSLIGSTQKTYYTDRDLAYGDKYYYAVTSYDFDGNESELSMESVYGISRPEGFDESISDFRHFPNNAGYDFSTYSVVNFNSAASDVYFDVDTSVNKSYLVVHSNSDIKDMGPTYNIYDSTFAPVSGWSITKDAVALVNHTYVIWTYDNHFAKMRIKSIVGNRIVFDWTYQTLAGEKSLRNLINPGVRNFSKQIKIRTAE